MEALLVKVEVDLDAMQFVEERDQVLQRTSVYPLNLGFGPLQVALIATTTLLGSGLLALLVGLHAHRYRYRTLLLAASRLRGCPAVYPQRVLANGRADPQFVLHGNRAAGFVPPVKHANPGGLSITELEYRKAGFSEPPPAPVDRCLARRYR